MRGGGGPNETTETSPARLWLSKTIRRDQPPTSQDLSFSLPSPALPRNSFYRPISSGSLLLFLLLLLELSPRGPDTFPFQDNSNKPTSLLHFLTFSTVCNGGWSLFFLRLASLNHRRTSSAFVSLKLCPSPWTPVLRNKTDSVLSLFVTVQEAFTHPLTHTFFSPQILLTSFVPQGNFFHCLALHSLLSIAPQSFIVPSDFERNTHTPRLQ